MLPLSEKAKVLELIRKEENCMLRLLMSMIGMNLLCVKLAGLYSKLFHRCVCIGKTTVYSGFSAIHGFRHPLGVLECIPTGGQLYLLNSTRARPSVYDFRS